jgi:hypothetical protein
MPKRPPISDLIGQTPGAQPRDEAHRKLASRRDQTRTAKEPVNEDFTAPEPDPLSDTEAFAKRVFERMMQKDVPPVRGTKPRLVTKKDDTEPDKAT